MPYPTEGFKRTVSLHPIQAACLPACLPCTLSPCLPSADHHHGTNTAKAGESGVGRSVRLLEGRTAGSERAEKDGKEPRRPVPPASEAGQAAPGKWAAASAARARRERERERERANPLLAVAGADGVGWLDGLIAGTQSGPGVGKKEETVSGSVSREWRVEGRASRRGNNGCAYGERKKERETSSQKKLCSSLDKWSSARGGGGNGAVNARVSESVARAPRGKNRQKGAISSIWSEWRKTTALAAAVWKGLRMRYAPPLRRADGGRTFTRFSYTRGR